MRSSINIPISLKQISRKLISFATFYSGICFLSNKLQTNYGARILCYHGISESPNNQYSLSLSEFVLQIEFLKDNYRIISIDQLAALVVDKYPLPSKIMAVSFDDGFKDFYRCAFPILKRYTIPATAFIPTGLIDSNSGLRNQTRLPEQEYLSWDQIREMSQSGIDFGSHSVSHKSLPKLSHKEIQYELTHSKARLETELKKPIKGFAFPYGTFKDVTPEITGMISESGFSWAVTCISGVNRPLANPLELRRTVIQEGDGLAGFKRVINGSLDGWILMQKLGYYLQKSF